jgi:hypothetical protein
MIYLEGRDRRGVRHAVATDYTWRLGADDQQITDAACGAPVVSVALHVRFEVGCELCEVLASRS